MNASWILGSAIAAILFASAAWMLERVVALYRRMPLRWVWVAAIGASLAFTAVGLLPRHSATIVAGDSYVQLGDGTAATVPALLPARGLGRVQASGIRASLASISKIGLPNIGPRTERGIFIAWAVASASLALFLLAAAWRLRAEKNEWRHSRVAGTPLLISPDFGPAIVGVLHPEIVVPQWITELDDASRRAIVAHEVEHLRVHDSVLLFVGLAVVVAMPWNPGLWLCWRGLRRTIELDCDSRVLASGMERTEYANILLAAWHRARVGWLPSPAFAERASGLGKRVEHLMRPEPRRRAMRTILGVAGAAALVLIASVTPAAGQRAGASNGSDAPYPLVIIDGVKRPELPPRYRYTGEVVAETTTTPTFKITYKGPTVLDSAADKLYPSRENLALIQTISAPSSVAHFGPDAAYGASLYYTKQYRNAGGAILYPNEGSQAAPMMPPGTSPSVIAGRIYDRMFAGISLTSASRATAMGIIGKYVTGTAALAKGPMLAVWPRVVDLTDERDAALRALLTREDDLAKFDVHATEGKPHGVATPDAIADNMFINLFELDKITLAKATEIRAHEIIKSALIDERALYGRAPGDFDGRVAIRRKRDADLRTLLTSDSDRAKFDVRAERTMNAELQR